MATTVTAKITVTEAQFPLIQDAATEEGKTVEEFLGATLGTGKSLQGIANDRSQQAFNRLQQAGAIPADVLAESRRFALANAPKATEASA